MLLSGGELGCCIVGDRVYRETVFTTEVSLSIDSLERQALLNCQINNYTMSYKFQLGDLVKHASLKGEKFMVTPMVVTARGIFTYAHGDVTVYHVEGRKESRAPGDSNFFGAFLTEDVIVPLKDSD